MSIMTTILATIVVFGAFLHFFIWKVLQRNQMQPVETLTWKRKN